MKCLALVCFLLILLRIESAPSADEIELIDEPVRYDGAQLWKVDFDYEQAKQTVFELQRSFAGEVAIWNTNGPTADVFVKRPALLSGAADFLTKSNVSYTIVVEDMQHEIETENPTKSEHEELQYRKARFVNIWPEYSMPNTISRGKYNRLKGAYLGRNSFDNEMAYWPVANWGHRLTWSAYHRLSDIYGFLDYLATSYPDLCTLTTIGRSVENRPLKVLRISNGNAKNKAVWIDGGIHAREWISPASVTHFINTLVEDWESQPAYIRNITWYIQPVVNPDGYEYTHTNDRLWRKNRSRRGALCSGVDLNRNFGYKWGGKGTSNRPCAEIYAGPSAFSEPETLAQKKFFERSQEKFFAFLTFHSYGQYILYPWGYDVVVPPDHQDLDRVGNNGAKNMQKIGQSVYSVGPSGSLLYPAAGASDDWAKSIGIKYSYTIELRDKGQHGFVLPAQFIKPTALEAQEFIHTVARAVAENKRY